MFHRFAAGSSIGALVIALAGLSLVFIPGLALPRAWPVTLMWCFVPLAWGVWAMLTPRAWFTERLPLWGAILGFVAAVMGAFVLNLPARVFDLRLPVAGRLLAVAVLTVLYYFLWMLVRTTYDHLVPDQPATATVEHLMKKAA